jgi:ribulose-5-phosphate 4-epimerase/fuculose-1-phosphate aldolase
MKPSRLIPGNYDDEVDRLRREAASLIARDDRGDEDREQLDRALAALDAYVNRHWLTVIEINPDTAFWWIDEAEQLIRLVAERRAGSPDSFGGSVEDK